MELRYQLTVLGKDPSELVRAEWFDTLDEVLKTVCDEYLEGAFQSTYCAIQHGLIHRIVIAKSAAPMFLRQEIGLITIFSETSYLANNARRKKTLN